VKTEPPRFDSGGFVEEGVQRCGDLGLHPLRHPHIGCVVLIPGARRRVIDEGDPAFLEIDAAQRRTDGIEGVREA
jgi:hypothetical protein